MRHEGRLDDLAAAPYRLPDSRVDLRGPEPPAGAACGVCLGGAETRAEGLDRPWPALLGRACGVAMRNLGVAHAGPQLYLDDPGLRHAIEAAPVAVIAPLAPANVSNRFYRVHRRANDRYVGRSRALALLFPEVDMSDVHYVGHLHALLSAADAVRYGILRAELARAWTARMATLLALAPQRAVLLSPAESADQPPPGAGIWCPDPGALAAVAKEAGAPVVPCAWAALKRGDRAAHRRLAEALRAPVGRILAAL